MKNLALLLIAVIGISVTSCNHKKVKQQLYSNQFPCNPGHSSATGGDTSIHYTMLTDSEKKADSIMWAKRAPIDSFMRVKEETHSVDTGVITSMAVSFQILDEPGMRKNDTIPIVMWFKKNPVYHKHKDGYARIKITDGNGESGEMRAVEDAVIIFDVKRSGLYRYGVHHLGYVVPYTGQKVGDKIVIPWGTINYDPDTDNK